MMSEPTTRKTGRTRLRLTTLAFVALLTLLAYPERPGLAQPLARNQPPRLSNVTASIGQVWDEALAKPKERGVKGTYRLCDDGPQNSPNRFGVFELTHRWGSRSDVWLLVRERTDLIGYDIYFGKPECVAGIDWSSTIPSDLAYVRYYPCYSVTLRVRDPGGR